MKPNQIKRAMLATALIIVQLALATRLRAQDTNTIEIIKQLQKRIEELEQKVKTLETRPSGQPGAPEQKINKRVEELDQQLKTLERERLLDAAAAEAKAKAAPKISLGEQGISLSSAKGDFSVQLKGVLQVDSRTFFNDHGTVGKDSLLLRRARPILQGTV